MCLVRGDKEKFLGIDEVTQDNFTGVSYLTGFFFSLLKKYPCNEQFHPCPFLSPRYFKDNLVLLSILGVRCSFRICFYINLLKNSFFKESAFIFPAAISFKLVSSLGEKLKIHSIDLCYGKKCM